MEKELTVIQQYRLDVISIVALIKATEEMIKDRKSSLNHLEYKLKYMSEEDLVMIGVLQYKINVAKEEIANLESLYNDYTDKLGVKAS
jgi:hypothetical protein